jgi:hypothetical protein
MLASLRPLFSFSFGLHILEDLLYVISIEVILSASYIQM